MQDFTVRVSPDTVVLVTAENEKDARAMVMAEIAKREGSKVHDQVFFDYETGIKNNTLRAELSAAEQFKDENGNFVDEREGILENLVGSQGFVRDSSGKIAITPRGQKILGLKPSVKNIIIDEKKSNTAGDWADLTGYAGPIFGAIATLSPQLRLAKWLQPLAMNSIRVARSLLAGAGSAAGAGVEEAVEIARGTQLQNAKQISKDLKDEFLLGAAAQGAGETLGGVFQAYFGKTASKGNIRDSNLLTRGFDLKYVRAIDRDLGKIKKVIDPGYKAPLKDVLKELKKRGIKPTLPKGIVSQAGLGRAIPSRGQQIAEMVGGPAARESKVKANLLAQIRGMFDDIGAKGSSVEDFINSSSAGKMAATDLKNINNKLNKDLSNVDLRIDKLLKTLVEEMNGAKSLPPVQRKALEKELQESLGIAFKTWKSSNDIMYASAEKAIAKADLDPTLMKVNRAFSKRFKEILDKAEEDQVLLSTSGKPYSMLKKLADSADEKNIKTSSAERIIVDRADAERIAQAGGAQKEIIKDFAGNKDVENVVDIETGGVEFLRQIRQIRLDLKSQQQVLISAGKSGSGSYSVLRQLTKEIDEYFKQLGRGDILIDDAIKKTGKGAKAVATIDKAGNEIAKETATRAITLLGKANKDYAKNIGKFEGTILKKIVDDIKFNEGKGNIDELFGLVVKEGNGPELQKILNVLGPVQKERFRAYMQEDLMKRLFTESLTETKMLNPVIFSQKLKAYGSTLKVLFGPKYDANMALLKEIQVLKPKLSKTDLNNFLKAVDRKPQDFEISRKPGIRGPKTEPDYFPGEEGFEQYQKDFATKYAQMNRRVILSEESPANKILEEMRNKSKLLDEKQFLDKSKFMQAVKNETPETIVKNIFRPNSAAEINLLKNNILSPESFSAVQENALGTMLSEAVSVGQLRSTARLTDIFKPGVLSSAIESYGDDTLVAMFGKESLDSWKAVSQSLDLQVTATKGGAAGGIMAGMIGANALDVALMPTIVGLKVFSNVLANPMVVRLLSKTEPGPVMQVIDAFEKALRFTLAQDISATSDEVERKAFEELKKVKNEIESEENAVEMNSLKSQIQQIQNMSPKLTSNFSMDIPKVQSIAPSAPRRMSPSLIGNNPANMDIAQQGIASLV